MQFAVQTIWQFISNSSWPIDHTIAIKYSNLNFLFGIFIFCVSFNCWCEKVYFLRQYWSRFVLAPLSFWVRNEIKCVAFWKPLWKVRHRGMTITYREGRDSNIIPAVQGMEEGDWGDSHIIPGTDTDMFQSLGTKHICDRKYWKYLQVWSWYNNNNDNNISLLAHIDWWCTTVCQ